MQDPSVTADSIRLIVGVGDRIRQQFRSAGVDVDRLNVPSRVYSPMEIGLLNSGLNILFPSTAPQIKQVNKIVNGKYGTVTVNEADELRFNPLNNPLQAYYPLQPTPIVDVEARGVQYVEQYNKLIERVNKLNDVLNKVYPSQHLTGLVTTIKLGRNLIQQLTSKGKIVIKQIDELLAYRKVALRLRHEALREIEKIRVVEIIKENYVVLSVRDIDLYPWTIKYINEKFAYGRGPSSVTVDCVSDEPINSYSDLGEEYTEYVAKGVDFLQHNLMMGGYRNTVQDLYEELVNDLRRGIKDDESFKRRIASHFKLNRLNEKEANVIDYLAVNLYQLAVDNKGNSYNYVAKTHYLTNILTDVMEDIKVVRMDLSKRHDVTKVRNGVEIIVSEPTGEWKYENSGLYERDVYKNRVSCLALLINSIRQGQTLKGRESMWLTQLKIQLDEFKEREDKPKIYFHVYYERPELTEYEKKVGSFLININAKMSFGPSIIDENIERLTYDAMKTGRGGAPKTVRRTFKYFGDNIYEVDSVLYELNRWVDNSYSGNLCGITCLTENPFITKRMNEMKIDKEKIIVACMLVFKLFYDECLYRMDKAKMIEVHTYILKRLCLEEICMIRYTHHAEGKNYYWYKGEKITGDELKNCKKSGVRVIMVALMEGHAFTVTNKDHHKYLMETFSDESTLKVSEAPRYNVIETININRMIKEYTTDKSKLFEFIGEKSNQPDVKKYKYYQRECAYIAEFEAEMSVLANQNNQRGGPRMVDKFRELNMPHNLKREKREQIEDELNVLGVRYIGDVWYDMYQEYNRIKTRMYCLNATSYGTFDYETFTNGKAVPYGLSYTFFDPDADEGKEIKEQGTMNNLNNNMTSNDLTLNYIITVADYMKRNKSHSCKIFAHNGGKFDALILKGVITEGMTNFIGDYKCNIDNDIDSGGRIKCLTLSLEYTEQVPINRDSDNKIIEYEDKTYHLVLTFVDSLCLLECRLEKIGETYGVKEAAKGVYPYELYGYIINNKLKLNYTRDELTSLATELTDSNTSVCNSICRFLNKCKEEEFDLVKVFHEYCLQDSVILTKGLWKAQRLYHKINLSKINTSGENILCDNGRGFLIDNEGLVSRCRFIDSVTLSGFSKVIKNYYVSSLAGKAYNGIDEMYLNTYTGGLTYNKKVQLVVSSQIKEICKNPYFYINKGGRNDAVINYFATNYEYDANKIKKTYKRENPPQEVVDLKDLLLDQKLSCILLLDANSLYPSAMYKMGEYGGFPVGNYIKFDTKTKDYEKIVNAKRIRWVGYVKVNWTDKGRASPEAMHPLVIRTKTCNRHLLATDPESNHYGIDDILYKSTIKEGCSQGLYTLEFINGVYWSKTDNTLGKLCKELYETRLKYKAEGSPIEVSIKKILNSFYGILLEKCHAEIVKYWSNMKRVVSDLSKPDKDGVMNLTVNKLHSDSVCNRDKLKVEYDRVKVNNYDQITYLEMKKLDKHRSSVHYGDFVLGMSKYIMNDLFAALDWDIMYTDTDSAFIRNDQFNILKKKDNEAKEKDKDYVSLMGDELGQFKSDFDEKFKKGTEDLFPKKDVEKYGVMIKESTANAAGLIKDYGVVSILSIFNAKKQYLNVLMGQVGADDETYITISVQSAGKGVDHTCLSLYDYIDIKDGKTVILDANKNRAVFRTNNTKTGVYIYDANTRKFIRTIRNMDVIAASNEAKSNNKK